MTSMALYLVRHGIAERKALVTRKTERERRLTPKGAAKMRRIAAPLRTRGVRVDRILTSPMRRARQTALILAEGLKYKRSLVVAPHLGPEGSLESLVHHVNTECTNCRRVLLVGHEPSLSTLISILVSGRSGMRITMKKGGLCKLSVSGLRLGKCAALDWLLTPSQILSD